jgi:hypothetical protein
MSPESALIERGTVASTARRREPGVAENPRTRRIGVNPGILQLDVHPTLSGRQEASIPYGVLTYFETFPDMKVPNPSVDPEDKSPADTTRDLTALEAVTNVRQAAWQSSRDMGFRVLESLTPLTDDEAARLVAAVFPRLAGSTCPYEEENTDGESGLFRCVTCRIESLESAEVKARAGEVGGETLRRELLAAFKVTSGFFTTIWGEWVAEREKRNRGENGLAVFGDAHLHVMRQIHKLPPETLQAEAIREGQQSQAEAIRDGMKEGMKEVASALLQQQQAPPAPAFDMEAIIEEAKRRAKEELRAEMDAEKKKPGK